MRFHSVRLFTSYTLHRGRGWLPDEGVLLVMGVAKFKIHVNKMIINKKFISCLTFALVSRLTPFHSRGNLLWRLQKLAFYVCFYTSHESIPLGQAIFWAMKGFSMLHKSEFYISVSGCNSRMFCKLKRHVCSAFSAYICINVITTCRSFS